MAAWLVNVTDKKIRGTALALQESTIDFGVGVGSFIYGCLTGWIGMAGSFLVIGFTVLGPAAFYLYRYLLYPGRSRIV